MKSFPLRISATCPCCDTHLFFDASIHKMDDVRGSTTDCGNCGKLLIVKRDYRIYDFNEMMNADDSRWPVDGSGTGSITVQ